MIKFTKLSFRNFMGYGNNTTTIDFDFPGTTLIVGENLDEVSNGIGSNGTGKTSCFQALVYALFDRIVSDDSTKDGLINNINKRDMEVSVEFTTGSGNSYKIIRQRKSKTASESNKTTLIENGKDISVDAAGTNTLIQQILGIPYELFIRIVVFSASTDSFLRLPMSSTSGPSQKACIEDLFGLTSLTKKAEVLKLSIKQTKSDVDVIAAVRTQQQQEQQRHMNQINAAVNRESEWSDSHSKSIATLVSKLTQLNGVDLLEQKQLHDQLSTLTTTLNTTVREHRDRTQELRSLQSNLLSLEHSITSYENNQCPHCSQSLPGAEDQLALAVEQSSKITAEIDDLTCHINLLADGKTQLQTDIAAVQDKIQVSNIEELLRLEANVDNMLANVAIMQQEVNPHTATVDSLTQSIPLISDVEQINQMQKKLDHQAFLLKLLTKPDSFLRKALLDKYLPYLNARVQYNLGQLGLPHHIEFQQDLSAKISLSGIELKFGNLSTGQRARVDFAFAVAFKEVRERLHGATNICMFDEVLDFGMDTLGVTACARLIKQIARTNNTSVYVISHRNEIDGMFDRKITVQMKDRFSNLVVQHN